MAVIEVRESHEDRSGLAGQIGRRLYRRHFVVLTNSAYDGPIAVRSAIGIPRPYEPYITATEYDQKAIVRTVTPNQRANSRTTWDVIVEYDSEFEPFDNPFTEPPEIEDDSEFYDEPLLGRAAVGYDPNSASPQSGDPFKDGDMLEVKGQGYVTSAGEPYDPPATRPQSRPVIIFTRNQAVHTVAFKVKFESSVNKYPWSGLQARQAFCRSIKAKSHVWKSNVVGISDIFYYRVSYTFALKRETWDCQLPDIGSYYLDYSGGDPVRKSFKVEATGEPRLGLLDHSNPDELGKRLNGSTVQWNRWKETHTEQDYSELNINLDLALEQRNTRPRRLGGRE